jgi:hypothetical protein
MRSGVAELVEYLPMESKVEFVIQDNEYFDLLVDYSACGNK